MPKAFINGHEMYYEVLGQGDPLLLMGGWGTFCHDNHHQLPRRPHRPLPGGALRLSRDTRLRRRPLEPLDDGPARRRRDRPARPPRVSNVHLVGLVGMGACICQEIAIRRPDLARSMLNTGAWCEVDDFLRDQLEMFRWIHRDAGFFAFQKAVTLLSFTAEYYNANKDKLLGPNGGWKELNGRFEAHSRLIDACVNFDSKEPARTRSAARASSSTRRWTS
jgi:3-oxoadipate enol-lactonase